MDSLTGQSAHASRTRDRFCIRSMSAPLRRVLVRRPTTVGDFAAAGWRTPDPRLLASQHVRFRELLAGLGCDVEVAEPADGLVDATYVRDPGMVSRRGAILFRMAKPARVREPAALEEAFDAAGVPVVARLEGTARADGGDMVWLDDDTLLVGRSYRTNAEAVRQLSDILAEEGVRVESVDVPHDRGPDHVLHLMSFLSPLADDLAAVYPPLAPVSLMEALADRGITVISVDPAEYDTMACNILPVRPGVVVMAHGNPRTRAALEDHGCEVHVYDGSEISLKGDGGPTCLTAPILRA